MLMSGLRNMQYETHGLWQVFEFDSIVVIGYADMYIEVPAYKQQLSKENNRFQKVCKLSYKGRYSDGMSARIGGLYTTMTLKRTVGVETNHSANSKDDSSELFTRVTCKQSLKNIAFAASS